MRAVACEFAFWSLVLASSGVAGQEAEQRESFLLRAEVVDKEVISSGITLPQAVRLELGGSRRRAVFKSAEVYFRNQNISIAGELQKGLHDSWKFEVAAYQLDRLLGLGMVPVTVARKIGGHEGALIDWVEDVAPEFDTSPEGFDMAAWEKEVARVWLFDYLAYNIDRTPDNLLVTSDFQVRLIDHSRAFQRFLIPMRPLTRFPRQVMERLRGASQEEFRGVLGPYLTDEEMEAFLERRKRLLARVDRLLASRPESEVYF
ncbi:MAG: hypothetical protein ACE5JI_02580 [Acidobacteriota bacterium]